MKAKKTVLALLSTLLLTIFLSCNTDADSDDSAETLKAPENLTVKTSSTKNAVDLTWDSVEKATYYWIFYNTSNNTDTAVYLTDSALTQYTIPLKTSGIYYFWVKSVNPDSKTEGASSNFSKAVSFEFTYDSSLAAPTNLAAALSTTSKNTIELTWNAVTGIEYYWIFYAAENDVSKAKFKTYEYRDTKTSIALSESGTYYFWVKSASSYYSSNATSSDFSTVAYLNFTAETIDAPTNLTVKLSSTVKNTVDLNWDAVDGIKYYWIYYATENDVSKAKYKTYEYSDTKTSIALPESGTYYFWIKSANSYYSSYDNNATSSDFSTESSVYFTHEELFAPTNTKAERLNSISYPGIKLSWDSAKAPCYHIYWATENDSSKATYLTSTSINSDTIYENVYNLVSGTTYYFWIKSSDGYSTSEYSSNFSEVASFTY